jgi:uncharacterized SAM-binding protein YcdF (DUF218 family)
MSIFLNIRFLILLSILLYPFWVIASVGIYSHWQTEGKADAAIVLGAAVWRTEPSPVFRERLNHAVTLYREGRVPLIVTTGGLAEGDSLSEGEAGARYLMARGIPAEAIVTEKYSRTTWQNLVYARDMLSRRHAGVRKVLIVSDPLHQRRSVFMARQLGWDAGSSPTPTTRYTGFFTRFHFLLSESWYFLVHRIRTLVHGVQNLANKANEY